MNQKTFLSLTGIIFLVIAVSHLLRVVLGWHAIVAGWAVPMWFSYIGVVVAGYLAFQAFNQSRR